MAKIDRNKIEKIEEYLKYNSTPREDVNVDDYATYLNNANNHIEYLLDLIHDSVGDDDEHQREIERLDEQNYFARETIESIRNVVKSSNSRVSKEIRLILEESSFEL